MYLVDEQYEIQSAVDRKGTSSYYTSRDGLAVIRSFLKGLSEEYRRDVVVMDPFAGSGVTLSAINDLVRPRRVIAIEINEGPCELARRILSSLYSDVEVMCGDALGLHGVIGLTSLLRTHPSLGGTWFVIGVSC
ncbi:DNA methyltransferase [Vulcanisaeta sp. JCM 16159]|uniref:DNA methyltransferase n=1 Tax=Vulcanisaeta sp. JCM 16159 TaxID=1295371 RepID=UPI001FB3701A|nr:DNA methyltransferase [Vulcanisaeta sp. JCM 16159]